MPLYELPAEAWPLQVRSADAAMFTTVGRDPNPFESRGLYERTLKELRIELQYLRVTQAWLQVVLAGGEADLRADGQLRSRAKIINPGVALTVETIDYGRLVYSCDQHEGRWSNDPPDWQINLRAITIGLKDLRRLERYGVADRGQQYAGFRELGAGTAVRGATQSREDVARYLATMAGWTDDDSVPSSLLTDQSQVIAAHRDASKHNHPDLGGNTATQAYINAARDHLLATL